MAINQHSCSWRSVAIKDLQTKICTCVHYYVMHSILCNMSSALGLDKQFNAKIIRLFSRHGCAAKLL